MKSIFLRTGFDSERQEKMWDLLLVWRMGVWVQGWKWQVGGPRPRHFLSSVPNDTGSVTDRSWLNSSVTLFPGFTKPFLFIFLQGSELNPDCPVQCSWFLVMESNVSWFFLFLATKIAYILPENIKRDWNLNSEYKSIVIAFLSNDYSYYFYASLP